MGREIYNIINDMSEVLNASQMQKVLVNRLAENQISDCMQTGNEEFLEMVKIPVVKITTEMLRKYLVGYQSINNCGRRFCMQTQVKE